MKYAAPVPVLITAIVCMTALEGLAIYRGVDGKFFAMSMGLIGAAAGVSIEGLWAPLARLRRKPEGSKDVS